jgi:flagellar motor switch protein FliN/FliY
VSFSASPLVPGTDGTTDGDDWARTARLVVAAVTEALPQIPSSSPLTVGEAGRDPATVTLPDPAGAAIVGYLSAGVEGRVLLVVGEDVVWALADTPFGAVEPAQALKPALEQLASALGGRLDADPTGIGVEDCLEVLSGAVAVLVPLRLGTTVTAFVGVALDQPLEPAPAPDGAAAAAPATRPGGANWGIDMLRDVEMEVTCELGRTRMTVRQLLALAPGDVVELDRLAGSPADLLVNGTLLARGEVVVVDESFGLRITEIVTEDTT